jgi:putative aldouronate transport system permease protein
LVLPALIVVILFRYVPMYGLSLGFKNFQIGNTIGNAPWVGFRHFVRFFNSGWFTTTIRNTLLISFFNNILTWPIPIILAIALHNCCLQRIKKIAQTATFIPYLLSIVVVISIVNIFCNGETGIINIVLKKLNLDTIAFFGRDDLVVPLYVVSDVWQNAGYSCVVYLAALTAVDGEVTEVAIIDGATKLKRIFYIDLPTIAPTIIVLLIIGLGRSFGVGPDKMLLLQTPMNLGGSEIIATYVYKTGIVGAQYSFATAVGLFNNMVNFILLLTVNLIAKKRSGTALF